MFRLLRSSSKNSPQPNGKRIPNSASEWRDEAQRAVDNADWNRALVCLRHAMKFSPFSRELRDDFGWVLEQKVYELRGDMVSPLLKGEYSEAARTNSFFDDEDDWEVPENLPEKKPARKKKEKIKLSSSRGIGDNLPSIPLRKLWLPATGAAMITITGLFFSMGISSLVGGWFGAEKLPAIEMPSVSPEVAAKLSEANTLLVRGEPARAAEVLRAARDAHPSDEREITLSLVKALRAVGANENRNRRYAAAARVFSETTSLAPADTNNWIDLGRALLLDARVGAGQSDANQRRRLLAEAETAYRKALEISSGDPAALYGLGQVYASANERQRAVEMFERVLAEAPSSIEASLARDQVLQLRGGT